MKCSYGLVRVDENVYKIDELTEFSLSGNGSFLAYFGRSEKEPNLNLVTEWSQNGHRGKKKGPSMR
jgi:hypothetical protein